MRSTLYASCPGCAEVTLVQSLAVGVRCASCGFDYGALRTDAAAFERWMLDNLRRGWMGQLTVLHLHHVLFGGSLADSNAKVVAFAEAHGVPLPKGPPASPWVLVGAVLGGVGLLFAVVTLLVTT